MQKIQLFINDELMELSDDTPMALTFQINNLADVKNQNGNTSNQFKVPMSQRNRGILGFPTQTQFTTSVPYRKLEAKCIQEGVEVVPNGFGEIKGSDENTADLVVLSGNVDFFDLVNRTIYSMFDEFLQYQETWNLANVVASQTRTSGMIWPIVDYGLLTGAIDEDIDVRLLRPGFFLHTIIDMIVAQTGFTATGSLLTDPMYQKLIVQWSNDVFEHGPAFAAQADNYSLSARLAVNDFYTSDQREGVIRFPQVLSDPSLSYNPADNNYTAKAPLKVQVTVTYSIRVRDIFSGGSTPTFNIQICKNGTMVIENAHPAPTEFHDYYYYDQVLTTELDLSLDDIVYIGFLENPNDDRVNAIMLAGSKLEIKVINSTEVIFNQSVQVERIFPDVSQKDLLKDTLQRFGIICSSDNQTKTIAFNKFGDIARNIPIAKDWSVKMLDQGKGVEFDLGDYSQVNTMLYQEDSGVTPGYGDSRILIDDTTLPDESNLVQSIFAASLPSIVNGVPCAIIKKNNPPTVEDYSINTQPRILIDNKVDLAAVARQMTFTDGTTDTVVTLASVPYFKDPALLPSLDWDYLRRTYYIELENVLERCKKISRWFLLDPVDIQKLDLMIPIFLEQESAYFYILKIDSWRNNLPVKVDLVKLQ